jgi:hypothetical protein
MKHTLALTLIISILFSYKLAEACRIVPLEKNKTKYLHKLIKDTPDIYVAEAVSAVENDGTVTFKVHEVVRGAKVESLTLNAEILNPNDKKEFVKTNTQDFGQHRAEIFWKDIFAGRTTFGPDCRLKPTFEIGKRYLILNKEPYQPKSFELMNSQNDAWYKHVRNTLYPPKIKKKTAASATTTTEANAPPSEVPSNP